MTDHIDRWKPGGAYHDTNLRDYETLKAEEAQRLGFQHDFSQAALKSAVLVNGGAIVALFTFLGNDKTVINPEWLFAAFGCFAFSLACGLAAYLGAFLSQGFYMNMVAYRATASRNAMAALANEDGHDTKEKRHERLGDISIRSAIGASVLSLVGFVGGSFCTLMGLVL